ncbi:MAG: M24 family metallopeptidase [Ilumatobacter sp.]
MDHPDLTPIDHAARIERVVEHVGERSLLVTDLTDLRWLTGFTTSHGWAVVRNGEVFVGTDGRYGDKAVAETAGTGATIVVEQRRETLEDCLHQLVAGTALLVDGGFVAHRRWLDMAARGTELVQVDTPLAQYRAIKDDAEVERIALAAANADAALAEVEPMLVEGATELDIRAELEFRMIHHGAEDRSYPTIVAAGPDHGARPHHAASRRALADGDTLIIDVGALVDGYHSDMTRSWVIGEATDEQRDTYELVARSQRAGLDAVGPGRSSKMLDAACRDVFEAAGRLTEYIHGTGHGVGLDIHEAPFHNQSSDVELRPGMVVTVEPGLYRGGFGGFRIEDLVLVTDGTDDAGHRVLTHTPKREL